MWTFVAALVGLTALAVWLEIRSEREGSDPMIEAFKKRQRNPRRTTL